VNIGVSGRARVGKSTLLQSISGLTDDQIPTGSGIPVTAVRSRIFHSETHQRAVLTMHSFESFRELVLKPFHDALEIAGLPATVDEFARFTYPATEREINAQVRERLDSVAMLNSLKTMQRSLASYRDDLTGGEKTVSLQELRPFVAYPTNEQANNGNCARRYLAVRDARIECSFPRVQVEQLGIIDLPGLGEVAATAESHHLAGLKNEVDVVLLVKRAQEGMAYWGKEDSSTIDLLDIARGAIKQRRDFVLVVLNRTNPSSASATQATLAVNLRDHIRRTVNENVDGKHLRVIEGDAVEQASVSDEIVIPVLTHLADRLPVMDDEIFESTRATQIGLVSRLRNMLRDVQDALRAGGSGTEDSSERLEELIKELQQNLASSLGTIVEDLKKRARSNEPDERFVEAVDGAYKNVTDWIQDGFGRGQDAWVADALARMRVDKGTGKVSTDETNRARVEISNRFCAIDGYFDVCTRALWEALGRAVADHLGTLTVGTSGRDSLERLKQALEGASRPCPTLLQALTDLLALRLDYRTQLHPRVRIELDDLNAQTTHPETSEVEQRFVQPVTPEGAQRLFVDMSQVARQAAYRTRNGLIQSEGVIPARAIHAAAEHFEDTLIRSGESVREIKRFAKSYRDEIWPGEFDSIDESNARYARVAKGVQTLATMINDVERGEA